MVEVCVDTCYSCELISTRIHHFKPVATQNGTTSCDFIQRCLKLSTAVAATPSANNSPFAAIGLCWWSPCWCKYTIKDRGEELLQRYPPPSRVYMDLTALAAVCVSHDIPWSTAAVHYCSRWKLLYAGCTACLCSPSYNYRPSKWPRWHVANRKLRYTTSSGLYTLLT